MKRALAVVTIVLGLALCISTQGLAQYLAGSAREDFIRSTFKVCLQSKTGNTETRDIPNSLFEGHCRCYAKTLADKIAIADIRNKAVTEPIAQAAATTCYQAMKVEALGLYKAGQYPKQ